MQTKKNIWEEEIQLDKLRNIGITAHIDAGKTTTTEKILYHAGEIRNAGKVHEGDTTTDFDEQERARGITIFSAAVTVKWKDCQINIIDTPGHIDFTAEVERSLRVLDGAVLVIDGSKGVQAQTETVWRQANKYHVPRIIFINKLDNADNEARFFESIKSIEEKLNANPLLLQLPIGIGKELIGIIDLVEEKAHFFKKNDEKENFSSEKLDVLPKEIKEKAEHYRKKLIEKIIEYADDKILSEYMEKEQIETKEIINLIKKATVFENYFPVFCGSAYKNIGVKLLLNGITNYLPSPLDKGKITAFVRDKKTKELEKQEIEILKEKKDSSNLLALVFKVVIDEHNNKLTFIRVYEGEINSNSYVYNSTKKEKERISRLLKIQAEDRVEIKKARGGEIVAVLGLNATTGDTLCGEKTDIILENINFSKTVISQAIEPKTSEDNRKLSIALKKMKFEDPSFNYGMENGEMVIYGMGELHLEVRVEELKSQKINLITKKQSVSFQETIENQVEIKHMHRKQTGGAGEMAEVHIKFEPNPGKGFEFVDGIRGEDIPGQYRNSVKVGLERIFSRGALLGYQIVDIKATLTGGSSHSVDSSTKAFETAGYNSFKENIEKFKFALLEPIMKAEVEFPSEYEGAVIGNLNSKRGEIEEIIRENNSIKVIVFIPLAETFGYTTTLRSLTAGRVNYVAEFYKYKKVPNNLLEKIKEEKK